ncbi:hypothetical protein [Pseudoclavibacter endophyticus]|uniref:Uncharacterized protein n=1 Tax=Pseudoclavibacter endophyticus TaxID=1778590 RepID=A0A6H9WCY8_9MICO|nr:hypothetical protein [Pseudoclavibacter endophyticus]KAB1648822.1 hypothetical protein F8O04_00510 [Pseudoclavibacter endophyticus]
MTALIAVLPFLTAVGIVTTAHSRRSPAHTWGPTLLLGLAFLAVALSYLGAPSWDRMSPGFIAGSALTGAAIAWWLVTRLAGSVGARVAIAVAVGICYTALQGMLLAPLVSFVLPLGAAAFAIWAPRARGLGMRADHKGQDSDRVTLPQI